MSRFQGVLKKKELIQIRLKPRIGEWTLDQTPQFQYSILHSHIVRSI